MKRTTKALSLLLSLCMMLSVFTFTVFAETQSGTCGDNLTWTLDDEGTLTISGTGDMYDYDDNYTATPWDSYGYDIKSIIIENGVTSIGEYAFCFLRALESIIIPNSVTSIGNYAFNGCSSLKSATISEYSSVISIGKCAFWGCVYLQDIRLPNSVITIGDYAFSDCKTFQNIYIPSQTRAYGFAYGNGRRPCNFGKQPCI